MCNLDGAVVIVIIRTLPRNAVVSVLCSFVLFLLLIFIWPLFSKHNLMLTAVDIWHIFFLSRCMVQLADSSECKEKLLKTIRYKTKTPENRKTNAAKKLMKKKKKILKAILNLSSEKEKKIKKFSMRCVCIDVDALRMNHPRFRIHLSAVYRFDIVVAWLIGRHTDMYRTSDTIFSLLKHASIARQLKNTLQLDIIVCATALTPDGACN